MEIQGSKALEGLAESMNDHLVAPTAFHAGPCQQAAKSALQAAKRLKGPDLEAAGTIAATEWRQLNQVPAPCPYSHLSHLPRLSVTK